jgi:uncharacterized protein (DUF111 family)
MIKRVIELRVELLKSRLNGENDERELEEIEFLERVLDEFNGTATGHILLDLLQGDPEDWLVQHPKGE